MAVDPGKKRYSVGYIGDDGQIYNLVMTRNHASASEAAPAPPGTGPFPHRWRPRQMHGISSDQTQKASVVLTTYSAYQSAIGGLTSFAIPNVGIFQITGFSGEKRPNLAPPLT